MKIIMPIARPATVSVMDDGKVVHAGLMHDLAHDEPLQLRLLGLSLDSHQ
jgi:branched-chain amino acid transport system ATP-binding protein